MKCGAKLSFHSMEVLYSISRKLNEQSKNANFMYREIRFGEKIIAEIVGKVSSWSQNIGMFST